MTVATDRRPAPSGKPDAVPVIRRVPRWAPSASLILCLVGLAISGYLTYEHYSGSTTLACPDTGAVNCLKVTTSTYSQVVGVPVAPLGLGFFVLLTLLCLPAAWRRATPWLPRARTGTVAAGVLFVVYLLWAELFRINAICLWCTAVHAVTLAVFAVVVMGEAAAEAGPTEVRQRHAARPSRGLI